MNEWINEWMNEWMYEWKKERMNKWMNEWMNEWTVWYFGNTRSIIINFLVCFCFVCLLFVLSLQWNNLKKALNDINPKIQQTLLLKITELQSKLEDQTSAIWYPRIWQGNFVYKLYFVMPNVRSPGQRCSGVRMIAKTTFSDPTGPIGVDFIFDVPVLSIYRAMWNPKFRD